MNRVEGVAMVFPEVHLGLMLPACEILQRELIATINLSKSIHAKGRIVQLV